MKILDQHPGVAFPRLTDGMTDIDVRRLQCLMVVFELEDGEVLIKEGDYTASLFIVQSGTLRISVGRRASPIELPGITAGQWVGEVSLLDPGRASATVQVAGQTVVVELSHSALKYFIRTNPEGAAILLDALTQNLAERLHRTSDGVICDDLGRRLLVDAFPQKTRGRVKKMLRTLSQQTDPAP